MIDKPRPGSFSAFLEERKRLERGSEATPPVSPIRLIAILAQVPDGAMDLTELMGASGMSFSRFAEALTSVKLGGVLGRSGAPEGARVPGEGGEVAPAGRRGARVLGC